MAVKIFDYYQTRFREFVLIFFGYRFTEFEDFQERWFDVISNYMASDETDLKMAIQSCKGAGKTTMQALTLIWFCMCFPKPKIHAMASTRAQTVNILLKECKILLEESGLIDLFEVQTMEIILIGHTRKKAYTTKATIKRNDDVRTNVITGMVASEDNPDRTAGVHSDFNLFVIDEASTLGSKVYNAIAGIFATGKSILILSGNPTDNKGTTIFYEVCTSNAVIPPEDKGLSFKELDDKRWRNKQWVTMKVSVYDLKRASFHKQTMERIYKVGTANHEMFVLAEFPLFKASNFIARQDLEDVTDPIRRIPTDALNELNSDCVVGVDIAWGDGGDYSCIVARCNNQAEVLYYSNESRDIVSELGEIILDINRKGARLVVDCSGAGKSILIWLKNRGMTNIIDVAQSKNSIEGFIYKNHKSELLGMTRDWIQTYKPFIEFPDIASSQKFVKEGLYMSIVPIDGKYDIGNKKLMSTSPDLFDALSFTFKYGMVTVRRTEELTWESVTARSIF